MSNFFQFTPVGKKPFWNNSCWSHTEDKKIAKNIWQNFTTVLTLTEQMRQSSDPHFQMLLIRARNAKLDEDNVDILNQHVATELPNQESLNEAVIMQENSSRHLTNCVLADFLADVLDKDLVFFPCHVSRNEINGHGIVQREEIYKELDGRNITSLGLLFFWKTCRLQYYLIHAQCIR